MALLKSSIPNEKTQIKISIDASVIEMAKSYCEFAGIKKIDEFFEKAADFVMQKDRDWKKQRALDNE